MIILIFLKKEPMKTIINSLIIISLSTVSLKAQFELIIGFGSLETSNQNLIKERTLKSYSRLMPHDPLRALEENRLYSSNYNTISNRGIQYEVGIGKTVKSSSNFTIKYAAIISVSNFSFLSNFSTVDSEILSSEIVDYNWPEIDQITPYCDETIFSTDYSELQNKEKPINIYSLNLSLGAEYYIDMIKLSVGSDIFLRTPIKSSEDIFVSDFNREYVNGVNVCTFDGHIENKRVDDLSHMNFGFAPYLAYQISERLRIKAGVRKIIGDTFYNSESETDFFFNPRSYNALETNIQVSYTFGKIENEEILEY